MAKTKVKTRNKRASKELDSVYFLKLVLYLILGSLWVRVSFGTAVIPIPLGLIFGVAFASHEHFQIDRKIEYAILLIAMFVGFWLPIGVTVAL